MNRHSAWQWAQGLSAVQVSIIVFYVAFLAYAASPQGYPDSYDMIHGAEVTRVSLSLARTGEFANPFYSFDTGYTAHTAPGYVFLFATVAKIFGEGFAGAIVLWALNVGFLALQMALLPILSQRLGLGLWTGVLAAAFGVICQPYRVLPEWEALATGAVMIGMCVLTVPYFREPGDWQHSLLLGLLWGIAVLVDPQCVLLLLAWAHFASRGNSAEKLKKARRAMIVVLAGVALACLPWFVRNYERFHSVFFVRDNLGLELYTSNNPCSAPTVLANVLSKCHLLTHPNQNVGLALDVYQEGEVQFNRERLHMALAWIYAHPRAFAWLTVQRFLKFWFPYLNSYRYAIPSGLLTILSVWGLALMFRRNRRAAWILGSTLLFYPLVHYVIQFEARYRYPIYWVTFLLAAFAVMEIARREQPVTQVPVSQERELAKV